MILTRCIVQAPKRSSPTEPEKRTVVKRRRMINNNTDYEYDLDRIKTTKRTRKPVARPVTPDKSDDERDEAFYEGIFTLVQCNVFYCENEVTLHYDAMIHPGLINSNSRNKNLNDRRNTVARAKSSSTIWNRPRPFNVRHAGVGFVMIARHQAVILVCHFVTF